MPPKAKKGKKGKGKKKAKKAAVDNPVSALTIHDAMKLTGACAGANP